MSNSSKSLLMYSREMLMSGIVDEYTTENLEQQVKDTAKKVEKKAAEVVGPKTVEAIKGTAKETAKAAGQSVKDAIVAKAKEKSGEAVISAGKWALSKLLPNKKK